MCVQFSAAVTLWFQLESSILKRSLEEKLEGPGLYLSAPGTGSATIVIKSLGRIPA